MKVYCFENVGHLLGYVITLFMLPNPGLTYSKDVIEEHPFLRMHLVFMKMLLIPSKYLQSVLTERSENQRCIKIYGKLYENIQITISFIYLFFAVSHTCLSQQS